MGVIVSPVSDPEEQDTAVRISFGWENTDREVRRAVKSIRQTVESLLG
jgi:cysteine sulfinate desulfinase/cysteine desulfurase-like protein